MASLKPLRALMKPRGGFQGERDQSAVGLIFAPIFILDAFCLKTRLGHFCLVLCFIYPALQLLRQGETSPLFFAAGIFSLIGFILVFTRRMIKKSWDACCEATRIMNQDNEITPRLKKRTNASARIPFLAEDFYEKNKEAIREHLLWEKACEAFLPTYRFFWWAKYAAIALVLVGGIAVFEFEPGSASEGLESRVYIEVI